MIRRLNSFLAAGVLAGGLIPVWSLTIQATPDFVPGASPYHAYLDTKILFGFELTPGQEVFVEVVNLGEIRRCLSVDRISLRTRQGRLLKFDSFLYDGTKSKLEGNPRACIRQRTRRKFELGYSFDFPQEVRKVVFLVGRLAYRLQPVTAADYQEFVENFDKINIGVSSEYLKVFKLHVLYRDTIYGSRIRYRQVKVSPTTEGTRGPVTLLSTFPKRTEKAIKKKKTGSVNIALRLDPNGEVIEATPESSLEFGLTERALYEVKNWWEFAPAFKNGEPIASRHRAKVIYRTGQDD